jgi:hypothetical protein
VVEGSIHRGPQEGRAAPAGRPAPSGRVVLLGLRDLVGHALHHARARLARLALRVALLGLEVLLRLVRLWGR